MPLRQKHIETRLDAQNESLKAAQEDMKKSSAKLKELEIDAESAKEKIIKLRQQQYEVKNNDAYRTIEGEIEAFEKKIVALEDRELEIMEEIEGKRSIVKEREDDLSREKKHVDEEIDVLKKRMGVIEQEIEAAKKERTELTTDIAQDWLTRYERIFERVPDSAIVPVENGGCGGCHMKLPPSTVHGAKKKDVMTLCNYCGRILYWNAY